MVPSKGGAGRGRRAERRSPTRRPKADRLRDLRQLVRWARGAGVELVIHVQEERRRPAVTDLPEDISGPLLRGIELGAYRSGWSTDCLECEPAPRCGFLVRGRSLSLANSWRAWSPIRRLSPLGRADK